MTDNSSDGYYLLAPVKLSDLGVDPNSGVDMSELEQKLEEQIGKYIEGNKDLMYSGADVSVVLVK